MHRANINALRYIASLAIALIFFGIHFRFEEHFQGLYFFMSYPALFLSALYFGLGPGIFTTIVSLLLIDYFFIPPRGGFIPENLGIFLAMLSYLGIGIGISLFAHIARKKSKAYNEQAKTLQTILNNMHEGLVLAKPSGEITAFNQSALRMHGFTSTEEILNKLSDHPNFFEIYNIDHNPIPPEEWPLAKILRRDHFSDYKVIIRRKDTGQEWMVSYNGVGVYNERGDLSSAILTLRDISDQVRFENRLKSAINIRDEFLSIASHELKTPLTSLMLQSQLQKRLIDKNHEQAFDKTRLINLMDQIHKLTNRLNRLVDDMLDISRIRTGTLSIRKEKTDLTKLTKDVVSRLQTSFEEAGMDLPVVHGEATYGHWDPMRIEQVVSNLLTNAIRYGRGFPIEIKIEQRGVVAHLLIKDRGIGIAPEDQVKIFERYERVVSSENISGFGLGLFITQQIVESHGGRIWVESRLGDGSTFHVDLPTNIH